MNLQILRTFLLIGIFSIVGCSDEDFQHADANRPNPALPSARSLQIKKVVQRTYDGTGYDTSTTDYIYDGNKLVRLHLVDDVNNVYDTEIIYNGVRIIQFNTSLDGVPRSPDYFNYIGDQISSITSNDDNQDYRTEYSYSNGNLNSVKQYQIVDQVSELISSIDYAYGSGNVLEEIKMFAWDPTPSHTFYTYDNKNNPLRGMNKYLRLVLSSEGFNGLSFNNPLTKSYYRENNPSNINAQHYQIEYNNNNYPISIKRFSENDFLISDTTIEYR